MTILITGSSGFIGTHLFSFLSESGYELSSINKSDFDLIKPNFDLSGYFSKKIDVVIHLAAYVHIKNRHKSNDAYNAINNEGTLKLARQAADHGVRRFIFISSIKVNGEGADYSYRADHQPNPQNSYANSKWNAELGLMNISLETAMEVVIIRPPLVYGPNVKANFLNLLKLINMGVPLPFASINNKRSLIFVGNLVSFIKCCVEHPKAANQKFLVSDGEDLSTPELISRLTRYFGKQPKLLPFPPIFLQIILFLLGRQAEAQSFFGSLTIDPQIAFKSLSWNPPFTIDEGLAETVKAYKINSK